jgi:hypothetical protein
MRKCNFTHSSKKNTPSPARLFTKLSNAQQHYLHISCTEFHPNRSIYMESSQEKRGYNCADFHETLSHRINGEILYRILWESNKRRRKYEKKYSCLFVKCGFQCSDFHKNRQYSAVLRGDLYVELHSNRQIKKGAARRNTFTPLSNICLSLSQSAKNLC